MPATKRIMKRRKNKTRKIPSKIKTSCIVDSVFLKGILTKVENTYKTKNTITRK